MMSFLICGLRFSYPESTCFPMLVTVSSRISKSHCQCPHQPVFVHRRNTVIFSLNGRKVIMVIIMEFVPTDSNLKIHAGCISSHRHISDNSTSNDVLRWKKMPWDIQLGNKMHKFSCVHKGLVSKVEKVSGFQCIFALSN